MKRVFSGRVWKFGDCIDSGNIKGVMAGLDPKFHLKVKPGDLIVAGINFGLGASAESAPLTSRYRVTVIDNPCVSVTGVPWLSRTCTVNV